MNLENLVHNGKNLFQKIFLASAVTAASLITAACPIVPPVPPTPPNPTSLNVNGGSTIVLTQEEAETISRVTDDKIYFTNPIDYLEIGDIIAADITESTPYGFLREITDISSDGKIVHTQQASLEDAIEDTDFEFSAILSSSGARILSPERSRDLEGEISLIDFNFNTDVNNIPILDIDGDPSNGIDVTANAHAEFGLKVIIGGKIEDYTIKRFEFRTVTRESSSLEINANLLAAVLDKEVVIKEFRLPPFTIGYIPTPIGVPIPLTVNPRVDFVVGADGYVAPITADISQEASLNVGILYENYQWNLISEFEKNLEFNPPQISRLLELKAHIGPKLRMPVWGVAGPYGELFGFLRLSAALNNPLLTNWDLYGGLEARLGVDVKAFGKTFIDFYTTILDEEWLLSSGHIGPISPEPPPETPTTETVTIQPGPEGKDAAIKHTIWPDGHTTYEGNGDATFIEVWLQNPSWLQDKRAVIQFPLSSIPEGSTIESAQMKLYGSSWTNFTDSPLDIYLSKLNAPWNESTINWETGLNPTNFSGTTFQDEGNLLYWHNFDITSLVQQWITTNLNYGVELSAGDENYFKFFTSDYTDDLLKRPILEVIYSQ